MHEHVDGRLPQLRLRRTLEDLATEDPVAHILDQQQTRIEVFRENLRRTDPCPAQRGGDGRKRAHVFGEMRDLAVGLAVPHGRPVRLAGRIHQDRRASFGKEPRVGTRRCISLQIDDTRIVPRRQGLEKRHEGPEAGQPLAAASARLETHAAFRNIVGLVEADVETLRGQELRHPLRPLDDRQAIVHRGLETDLVRLLDAAEPIHVEMRNRDAVGPIELAEREGRARDLVVVVADERSDQRARERRFARAEIAVQRHHVADAHLQREALREARDARLVEHKTQARVHEDCEAACVSGRRSGARPNSGKRTVTVVP